MLISNENIQEFINKAGSVNYYKAKEILKNNYVNIEKFQIGWEYEYIYVYAKVNNDNKNITVNFTIDILSKNIETYHCQCNYYSSRICPHTLACILKFCEDERYEKQAIDAINQKQRESELLKFQNFIKLP